MSRTFISIFGLEVGQDVRRTAIAATRAGYAVVPVAPGGKAPLCTLNTRELREQGRDHLCGVHHALTDPVDADRVFARLGKKGDRINIGVVAGPSRLVLVDADNSGPLQAFRDDWAEAEGEGYRNYTPTVSTPGLSDGNGGWRHRDGGHFYFDLPDGEELPWDVKGSMTRNGYDIRWGMSQTLVPPSVRPEGAYSSNNDALPAPAWLLGVIRGHLEEVVERRLHRAALTANDDVAAWSVAHSWNDLLEPHDWAETGKLDRCGCPVWTKPGGGSTSYKSATAHDPDCTKYDNIEGHGPLHLWTTEPPEELMIYVNAGTQTITKLMFVAAMEYSGDVGAAMAGLGIVTDLAGLGVWLDDQSQDGSQLPIPEPEPEVHDESQSQSPYIGIVINSKNKGSDPDDQSQPESQPESQGTFWVPEDAGMEAQIIDRAKRHYMEERAVEWLSHKRGFNGPAMLVVTPTLEAGSVTIVPEVAQRIDGVRLLYRRRVNTIFGPSESAKSWFTYACALSVSRAGGRALVVDMEDDQDGFISRMTAIGANEDDVSKMIYVRPWGAITAAERATIGAATKGCDLIVMDSLDAYLALQGMESNNATSVRAAGAWLKSLAHTSGAALLLVDHSTEKGDGTPARTAMGSSAKKQFIDGSSFRADRITLWRPGALCRTLIMVGKDRPGWAKAHGVFPSIDADWGRIAELRMTPNKGDLWKSELELLRPPSYEEESGAAESDLLAIEDRVIDFLRSKAGVWQTRTAVYGAAGDKNGRGMIPEAVTRLVKAKIIEHRETLAKGRKANEYRYSDDEAGN